MQKEYKFQKEELLAFYSHLGLLVDFELKSGYEDYPKLRDQIQFNMKHWLILTEIDILSVDIEGGEYNCLLGVDLKKYKPKVIVLENVTDDKMIRTYLESHQYTLDRHIAYNQYYVHAEYRKEQLP